jgi:hypothetical protein
VQRFLGFFQVLDRFIDTLVGFFKALGRQAPSAPKRRLEFVELGFGLGDSKFDPTSAASSLALSAWISESLVTADSCISPATLAWASSTALRLSC